MQQNDSASEKQRCPSEQYVEPRRTGNRMIVEQITIRYAKSTAPDHRIQAEMVEPSAHHPAANDDSGKREEGDEQQYHGPESLPRMTGTVPRTGHPNQPARLTTHGRLDGNCTP